MDKVKETKWYLKFKNSEIQKKKEKKMKRMIVLRNFFRNGDFIHKDEIIFCDSSARKQMLEEGLARDTYDKREKKK